MGVDMHAPNSDIASQVEINRYICEIVYPMSSGDKHWENNLRENGRARLLVSTRMPLEDAKEHAERLIEALGGDFNANNIGVARASEPENDNTHRVIVNLSQVIIPLDRFRMKILVNVLNYYLEQENPDIQRVKWEVDTNYESYGIVFKDRGYYYDAETSHQEYEDRERLVLYSLINGVKRLADDFKLSAEQKTAFISYITTHIESGYIHRSGYKSGLLWFHISLPFLQRLTGEMMDNLQNVTLVNNIDPVPPRMHPDDILRRGRQSFEEYEEERQVPGPTQEEQRYLNPEDLKYVTARQDDFKKTVKAIENGDAERISAPIREQRERDSTWAKARKAQTNSSLLGEKLRQEFFQRDENAGRLCVGIGLFADHRQVADLSQIKNAELIRVLRCPLTGQIMSDAYTLVNKPPAGIILKDPVLNQNRELKIGDSCEAAAFKKLVESDQLQETDFVKNKSMCNIIESLNVIFSLQSQSEDIENHLELLEQYLSDPGQFGLSLSNASMLPSGYCCSLSTIKHLISDPITKAEIPMGWNVPVKNIDVIVRLLPEIKSYAEERIRTLSSAVQPK